MAPGVAHDPRAKSPALACFLSLMPGLGQVYTGYYVRGFTHIIIIAGIITLLASGDMDELTPFLALFMAFFWLHNVIDAGRRAAFYNQTLAGGTDADAFPPEMKLPGMSGSIFAGLGLIVVGIIALSYTKYDMSLTWLEDWWPVIPILVGVYLVGLAVRDRMKEEA
jgi:TM2 domain-containing membrane protein YozV